VATAETQLKALMVAGTGGNATAYRALLTQLSRHLRAYFNRRLARSGRPVADAEDLVQEALLAIHANRHTFDPGEPFTPWVHAIARYKLIDYLRRTRASSMQVPLEHSETLVAENDDHAGAESTLDLDKLLELLPEKMRRAIRCVKIEGLSVAETAHRCGMSESAVKVNVHRGLRALSRSVAARRGP
jgi:RNA polymerase sigma-70 factor, ECF subfamily